VDTARRGASIPLSMARTLVDGTDVTVLAYARWCGLRRGGSGGSRGRRSLEVD